MTSHLRREVRIETMQVNPMLLVGKVLLTIMWVLAVGAFFVPGDSTLLEVLRLIFWGTLGVHVIECAIFYKSLRDSGRPLGSELVQILLFGVVHYASVRESTPQDPA
jgi:uncharacterized protein YhhL (DUF1145 family)